MTDATTVGSDHLRRAAFVYIRQSSLAQVENNTESTRRQYALVDKALSLGWPRAAVSVVDDDLGLSGTHAVGRSGFAHMATEIAMGGLVSSSAWRSHASRATMPTGTACSTSARSLER
jgi:hypothetical protein